MKRKSSFTLLAALFAFVCAFICSPVGLPTTAGATTIGIVAYESSNPVAIFGSGNPNGHWVQASSGNVSVDLRFKERGTPNTNNDGMGTYMFAVGTNVNLEFSASSGTQFLSDYRFLLSIDIDPTANTNWITFNPLLVYQDNSYGNSSTPNGAGFEGAPATNYANSFSNSLVQNSERDIWLGLNNGLDATYNAAFTAYAAGDVNFERPIARTEATLEYGNGAASVPDAGSTLGLMSLAIIGLMGLKKFRPSKKA